MRILIPAYEPKDTLIKLIDEIQAMTDTPILVINDGSSEEYNTIFNKIKKRGIELINHQQNKGKGETIKTGIKYLLKIGENEGVVSADCDGQHTPKDIVKVIEKLKTSKKDLILGVRDFNEKKIPFKSKFGNRISKLLFWAMTGEKIQDTQTGLRGYSRNIFETLLEIPGNRYDYEFNVLLEIKEKQISYEQVPIETIYENNNKTTHFRPIKDSILIYKPVCKFIMSSIVSAIIDFSLLIILENIFHKLLLSVVISRIISSAINFTFNKNFVFNSGKKTKLLKMLIKYYSLVVVIMILNYIILKILYGFLGINLIIAKIITEIILYSFSFIIQKRIVF